MSFLCNYYFRLCDKELRIEFLKSLEHIFEEINLTLDDIYKMMDTEMMIYIKEIGNLIPENIAINKALKENTFLIITCFMTKVPLFICGKPGSSKTLSLNLVLSSMNRETTNSELFKILPSL